MANHIIYSDIHPDAHNWSEFVGIPQEQVNYDQQVVPALYQALEYGDSTNQFVTNTGGVVTELRIELYGFEIWVRTFTSLDGNVKISDGGVILK